MAHRSNGYTHKKVECMLSEQELEKNALGTYRELESNLMKNCMLDREVLEALSSVQNPRLFLVVTLFDFHFTPFKGFIEVETAFFLFEAAANATEVAYLDPSLLLLSGGNLLSSLQN